MVSLFSAQMTMQARTVRVSSPRSCVPIPQYKSFAREAMQYKQRSCRFSEADGRKHSNSCDDGAGFQLLEMYLRLIFTVSKQAMGKSLMYLPATSVSASSGQGRNQSIVHLHSSSTSSPVLHKKHQHSFPLHQCATKVLLPNSTAMCMQWKHAHGSAL